MFWLQECKSFGADSQIKSWEGNYFLVTANVYNPKSGIYSTVCIKNSTIHTHNKIILNSDVDLLKKSVISTTTILGISFIKKE